MHLCAVLFDFLRQMSETRKMFDGNNHWYSGYDIPFPVVSEENKLPHYTALSRKTLMEVRFRCSDVL